eukprot:9631161-Lingulodinium_polyedra.AAC.1
MLTTRMFAIINHHQLLGTARPHTRSPRANHAAHQGRRNWPAGRGAPARCYPLLLSLLTTTDHDGDD